MNRLVMRRAPGANRHAAVTQLAKEAGALRQTWMLEDYAAQVRAVRRYDLAVRVFLAR